MSEASFPLRRLLLWAMLGSLAAAAAAGILAVLAPGTDITWQVVAMAIVTAVSCGLALAASRHIEKPGYRVSSMAAMTLILVEFLLALLLIWNIPQNWSQAEETVVITMVLLVAGGIPIVASCRFLSNPSTHIAGIVGLILFGISLAYMLIAEWVMNYSSGQERHVFAGFYGEVYSFPIICSLVGMGLNRHWFRWIGVISSAVGGWMAVYAAVENLHGDPPPFFIWATVLAVFIAHLNLTLQASLPRAFGWLRWSTIVAVAATGVLVGSQINARHQTPTWDLVYRLTAAMGICAGCGTLAIAIIARMTRKTEHVMIAPADLHEIQLQCPGCQAKQTLPLGDSKCSECGLRFQIKVDEPRCETCGYLLYRLKSDRCPECGTPIAAKSPTAPAVTTLPE